MQGGWTDLLLADAGLSSPGKLQRRDVFMSLNVSAATVKLVHMTSDKKGDCLDATKLTNFKSCLHVILWTDLTRF